MQTRVIKVGGSLLDWAPLPQALENWLAQQPPAFHVLIAGGGPLADAIRQADQTFSLNAETAHWLCIDAMSITARLLASLFPQSRLIHEFDQLQAAITRQSTDTAVFDPHTFLTTNETQLPGTRLPRDWSVTSDSIAARVAKVVAADELVLLKSNDPPAIFDQWSRSGFVDTHFPIAALNLSVVAINLRRVYHPHVQPTQN